MFPKRWEETEIYQHLKFVSKWCRVMSAFQSNRNPWNGRVCDGVCCRKPVCIGRRLPLMTLSDVATLTSSLD